MSSSERLEHEAEVTRAQIADSLAELRERMTPGQVVEQVLDYARDGRPAEFFRNLGRQVVDNPVPVALIGAGLGWLIMAGRGHHASGNGASHVGERASEASRQAMQAAEDVKRRAADRASGLAESVSDVVDSGSNMADDVARSARHASSQLRQGAGSAGASVADAASSAYGATAAGARRTTGAFSRSASAVGRSASAVGSSAVQSGRSAVGFLKDEPLVLAGIGLALGAAIGAALPSSDAEDRVMGDTSDELKRDASAFAEAKWEKGKAVAETAAEKAMEDVKHEVKQAAEEEGLMPQGDGSGEPFSDREPENQASLIPESDRDLAADGAADFNQRDVVRPGE